MAENVAWNLSAGGGSAGISGTGQFSCDALTRATASAEDGTPVAMDLQLSDVSNIQLMAITASRYDGTVSVQSEGADAPSLAMTGPIVAFGSSVAQLTPNLNTLTVTVGAGADPAEVEILIARDLT